MKFPTINLETRIALIYLLFGGLWILLSDRLLAALIQDTASLTQFQTFKGWLFVGSSAALIYFLLRQNLSTQRRIEKEKLEVNERYRLLFNNSLDAILLTSPDGTIWEANPAACRMFGWTEAEICSLGRDGIIHSSDPLLPPALEERARSGKFIGELNFIRKDGATFPCEVSSALFRNSQGQDRASMIIRDISERKQAEIAQREQSAMLDFAHILVRDLDSRIVYWNQGAEVLYGWTKAEAINQVSHSLLQTQFPRSLEATRSQLLQEGHWEGELVHTRRDGSQVIVASHQVLYRDPHGKPARILEVNNDITELKITQKKLSASLEELRQLSARLAELEDNERRLLAKELHDQVGQSLTALSINLTLIRNRVGRDTPEALAARFNSPLELVNEITDKIRSIMAELHPPVLDDYGLAAALKWFTDRLMQQTGLQVEIIGDIPHLTQLHSIEMSFYRIVQEALNNIVKYAKTDRSTIILEEAPDSLLLAIIDEGAGFDPALPPHPDTAHWGLLTMRERAEGAGGHLQIESAPGQGTRITVRIPR